MTSIARRLVEPASSLDELTARLNARLLTALLLALVGMVVIGAIAITVTAYSASTALSLIPTLSILVMVLMYHREQIERSRQATLAESEARSRRLADNALHQSFHSQRSG